MIDTGIEIKRWFFDRRVAIDRVDAATRRVLSKFGAYVRRSARSSIRKRKRPSAPGRPPSSHTGLLRKFIYFAFDPDRRSVVVGPVQLHRRASGVPLVLEYGGRTTVRSYRQARKVTILPRPYMRPAFEKNKTMLPAMWTGSVRRRG